MLPTAILSALKNRAEKIHIQLHYGLALLVKEGCNARSLCYSLPLHLICGYPTLMKPLTLNAGCIVTRFVTYWVGLRFWVLLGDIIVSWFVEVATNMHQKTIVSCLSVFGC